MVARDERPLKETTAGRLKEIVEILARYNLMHGLSPEKLLNILEDLGPTFVKLGQIMSMRADMIPEEYCRELTKLRAEVRPMSFTEVMAVLEGEYGEPCKNIFSAIEEEPLGSASIAQVHAACLKDGKRIVIKVQRPGIYEKMSLDVKLMHKASGMIKIAGRAGKVIDFNTVLDEMWAVAQQEMDFMIEAGHIKEFIQLNEGINYIAFPEVEWHLTTPRVLVMEYVEGIQIDETDKLLSEGYDLKEICEKLAANYVKQVINDGFFHADPHPGNIRVCCGKIVWLDLGMVGRLTNRDRELFKNAVIALGENDIYSLKDIVLALGKHDGNVNHDLLYTDIEDMLSKYGSMEFANINAGQFITELVKVADKNGISMPQGVTMLGRGIITIEGVLTKVYPEINFLDIIKNQMSGYLMDDFDPVNAVRQSTRLLYSFSKRAAELPMQVSDILKMTSHGQAKINIKFTDTENAFDHISKIVNGLIITLLDSAFIIGSSLLCLSDIRPVLWGMPLLSVIGFGISGALTAGLIYHMVRKKQKRKPS